MPPKKIRAGSKAAVARLEELNFDPIEKLVYVFNKLESECAIQEGLRDGSAVMLNPATGKPMSYWAEHHLSIINSQGKVAESLLRYGYSRVSEAVEKEVMAIPPLTINLTQDGDVFTIGNDDDEELQ